MPTFKQLGYDIGMWMHAVAYKLSNILNLSEGGYHQTEGISYTDQEWIFLPMSTVRTIRYFNQILYKYLVGREGQTMNSSNVIKNIWMEAKGEKVMIGQYKSLTSKALNKQYLWNRLRSRLNVIYATCITAGKRNTYDLQLFDTWLKRNAPNLYEDSNTVCATAPKLGLSVPYIKKWRDGTLKYSLKFRIWKLYRCLQRYI